MKFDATIFFAFLQVVLAFKRSRTMFNQDQDLADVKEPKKLRTGMPTAREDQESRDEPEDEGVFDILGHMTQQMASLTVQDTKHVCYSRSRVHRVQNFEQKMVNEKEGKSEHDLVNLNANSEQPRALKRSANLIELKIEKYQVRPFKRQAVEDSDSNSDSSDESDGDRRLFQAILSILRADAESRTKESLKKVYDFTNTSILSIFSQWDNLTYLGYLDEECAAEGFNLLNQASKHFADDTLMKNLLGVFETSSIHGVFTKLSETCPFMFHVAIKRTLLLKEDDCIEVLTVIIQCAPNVDYLVMTVDALVTSAYQIPQDVLQAFACATLGNISSSTLCSWFKMKINPVTLNGMIKFCHIDESVLSMAIATQQPGYIVKHLSLRVKKCLIQDVIQAKINGYPAEVLDRLISICDEPNVYMARLLTENLTSI